MLLIKVAIVLFLGGFLLSEVWVKFCFVLDFVLSETAMCITSQAQCRCPMLRQAGRSTSQPEVLALVSMAQGPPHISERAAIVRVANASAKIDREAWWRSLPAKCAARHQAKDAVKFRRHFARVELPSRKFHRNSTANFTAIKSQTHQDQ